NPAETGRLISEAPEGFEVYSGDDALTLCLLAMGAVGVIGVATHWAAVEHQRMIAAFQAGDVARARELHVALLPSFDYETSIAAPNPIPTKCLLRSIGLPVGHGRAPMDVTPDGLEKHARAVLAGTELGRELGIV
ncbi:MAG: dihydrodipicolinate synthase family protein, partial [Acidimicrobiales bacterium]|nr:dihydrodipicolinate synthase family protein [Acidimicrobiales bacterium]